MAWRGGDGTTASGDGSDGGGGGNGDVLMVGAWSSGGSGGSSTDACGWTSSPTFFEQPLEREELLFFSQMTARVCGGGPFPSYRAQNGLRGERAHLRPATQSLNILIENKKVHKE